LLSPYSISLDPKNPSFDLGHLALSRWQVRVEKFDQAAVEIGLRHPFISEIQFFLEQTGRRQDWASLLGSNPMPLISRDIQIIAES